MDDLYNIMSHQYHQHDHTAISGNLEENIPMIYPALIDYDHVNPIFFDHLPSPPLEYYDHHHHDVQHNNDHVDQRTTDTVVVGDAAHDLSFWSGEDDHEKASAGTLESIVDQPTRLVPTRPVLTITYYGGNIYMINDDDMNISPCFGYNPQQIITTMATTTAPMAVNDILVPTNDTHGLEIEHQSDKEKEETYAVNNEAVEMDNYVEAVEIELRRASLFTYAATTTTSTQSSVPDHHTQAEGSKKTEKCSTSTSSTNQRSKATHNKAERKRRNTINQRMEVLKRLVPNICHKTDQATILDQVIEYIKKLQNQRDQWMMMSSYGMNNNMKYPMMIPMSYYMYMQQQQQLHMSMMADDARMGMGVDLGSMHTNPIMHPNMIE